MKCPRCKSTVKVVDNTHMPDNSICRRRKCTVCGFSFYTCENAVEYNAELAEKWAQHNRSYNRYRRKGDV